MARNDEINGCMPLYDCSCGAVLIESYSNRTRGTDSVTVFSIEDAAKDMSKILRADYNNRKVRAKIREKEGEKVKIKKVNGELKVVDWSPRPGDEFIYRPGSPKPPIRIYSDLEIHNQTHGTSFQTVRELMTFYVKEQGMHPKKLKDFLSSVSHETTFVKWARIIRLFDEAKPRPGLGRRKAA
jgi:hypothetical protein